MHLTNRVKRLERGARPAGGCPVCHGEGPLPPHFTLDEAKPVPPMPVCSGCGKAFSRPFRVVRLPREEPGRAA